MRSLTWLSLALLSCSTSAAPPALPVLDADDADRDGDRAIAAGGGDCADHDPSVHGAAQEVCNGADDDCDGRVDQGFACIPGLDELCGDGRSRRCGNDCTPGPCVDAALDCAGAGSECTPGDAEKCDTGCAGGSRRCTPGCTWTACVPPPERCNGLDDDCDGDVDEGLWGLASGLHVVEECDGDGPPDAAVAVTEEGMVAVVAELFPEVHLFWVDHDGQRVGDSIPLWPESQSSQLYQVIPAGRFAVVIIFADRPTNATVVSVVSPEGIRSQWLLDDAVSPPVVWTGTEILIVKNWNRFDLLAFDLDGSEVRPARRATFGTGVWSGESVVAFNEDGLGWFSPDGERWRHVSIDALQHDLVDSFRPLLAQKEDALLVVARSAEDELAFTSLTLTGDIEWSRRVAVLPGRLDGLPNDYTLSAALLPVEGGWLVAGEMGGGAGGMWIDDQGVAATPLANWTPTGNASFASDGTTAWVELADHSVARLGCRD